MTTSTTTDTAAARPRILYACRANGGRSVASRVLTAYYGGDAVEASSAGSEPGDHIHAEVADVLTGLGLDVSGEVPKGVRHRRDLRRRGDPGVRGVLPVLPGREVRGLAAGRPQGSGRGDGTAHRRRHRPSRPRAADRPRPGPRVAAVGVRAFGVGALRPPPASAPVAEGRRMTHH